MAKNTKRAKKKRMHASSNLRAVKIQTKTVKEERLSLVTSPDNWESAPTVLTSQKANYSNMERPETVAERINYVRQAAYHIAMFLDTNPVLTYPELAKSFKITHKHFFLLQTLLIETAPENRRWLIIGNDCNNLPTFQTIRSVNKPEGYTGPTISKTWDAEKAYLRESHCDIFRKSRVQGDRHKAFMPDPSPSRKQLLLQKQTREIKPKLHEKNSSDERIVNYITRANKPVTIIELYKSFKIQSLLEIADRLSKLGIILDTSDNFNITVHKVPLSVAKMWNYINVTREGNCTISQFCKKYNCNSTGETIARVQRVLCHHGINFSLENGIVTVAMTTK